MKLTLRLLRNLKCMVDVLMYKKSYCLSGLMIKTTHITHLDIRAICLKVLIYTVGNTFINYTLPAELH